MNKIKIFIAAAFAATCLFVPAVALAQSNITNAECAGINGNSDINSGDCNTSVSGPNIESIVSTIINILSWIVGVVSVIMIIIGGFRYIISSGNDTSVTSAKNTILYAIVGLIVVALAQVIVHFVMARITST